MWRAKAKPSAYLVLRQLVPRNRLLVDDLGYVRLLTTVTLARHPRAAHAAQLIVPGFIGVDLAHPPYAETNGTVLIHSYKLFGVRNGEDLSALRNSCSA